MQRRYARTQFKRNFSLHAHAHIHTKRKKFTKWKGKNGNFIGVLTVDWWHANDERLGGWMDSHLSTEIREEGGKERKQCTEKLSSETNADFPIHPLIHLIIIVNVKKNSKFVCSVFGFNATIEYKYWLSTSHSVNFITKIKPSCWSFYFLASCIAFLTNKKLKKIKKLRNRYNEPAIFTCDSLVMQTKINRIFNDY